MKVDVIAIDPSLTSAGIVKGTRKDFDVKIFESKPLGRILSQRVERIEPFVLDMVDYCEERSNPKQKPLILIEGYSFGSRGQATLSIAELGGVLRWELWERASKMVEVAPKSLKKFTTGNGNSKKHEMAISVFKRWKVDFKTEDEVDAFALFQLGLGLTGKKFKQQYSNDIVEKVKEDSFE